MFVFLALIVLFFGMLIPGKLWAGIALASVFAILWLWIMGDGSS